MPQQHRGAELNQAVCRIIWKGFINKAFADCVTLVLSIIAQRFATWVWWVGTVVSGNLLRITSVRPSIPSPYQQQPTTLANNATKNMRIDDIKCIGRHGGGDCGRHCGRHDGGHICQLILELPGRL